MRSLRSNPGSSPDPAPVTGGQRELLRNLLNGSPIYSVQQLNHAEIS